MKDNKRKIYHLFVVAQIFLLLAVCVLPVIKQVKSMTETAIGKDQTSNDSDTSNHFGDSGNDDTTVSDDKIDHQITDNTEDDSDKVSILEQLSPEIAAKLESMTLEEKVAQLFIISPEALTGNATVNAAGNQTKTAINQYPVGGLYYTAQNMNYSSQVETMLQNTQSYSQERIGLPMLLGVTEDGGAGSAFTGNINFDLNIDTVAEIGASNNPEAAKNIAKETGIFLKEMGFNFILGPIADLTVAENSETEGQTFGNDTDMVSNMVTSQVKGFKESGIASVLKYFPGKGYATKAEEGELPVATVKLTEFEEQFKVYKDAFDAGAEFVMVGHIRSKDGGPNGAPASMYTNVVTEKLRYSLGFEGLIMTEALNKECITRNYSSVEAALSIFVAGADIIFLPENFEEAYHGMLQAARDGRISEERVDESVARVLKVKMGE